MSTQKRSFIESAMRNRNIVMIFTALLMVIGVVALLKMPRNEFPQFTIRQGVVVGIYPGATSAEVESQLTRVVENYIFEFKEVKKSKTYSYSREGIMYVFVELNDDVNNADKFWSKLKHGLNELKMTLPPGVLALVANSDFGDTSALLITLSSNKSSYRELEEQLKLLEAECRKIPATSKMKHFGLQNEEIEIKVSAEKLNEYNIKSLSLLGNYQLNGIVSPAGELNDEQYNRAVHFPPNFQSEVDLSNQIVYSDPNGNIVRLKDIASIQRKGEKPQSYIRQNGKKTILLSLEMQAGNNIVEYGQEIDRVLNEFKTHCPDDIEVAKISELPKYVDESVSNFMKEFLGAIVAVVLVTMLLLPFRVASVAGITVPISVLITLSIIYFAGIELHTVSLAVLILVLGMIVDNSIVIIDNHVDKIDKGMSPWHAAIVSAKELVIPIITATLAIIAAYLPLPLFVPGFAGEFMQTIPIVVSIALTVSVLVATLLVPFLNFVFIKKGLKAAKSKNKKKTLLDWLQGWFDKWLEKAFRHPKMIVAGGLLSILLALGLFKTLDQKLFPEMDRNQFAVEIYLPTGAALENTAQVIDSLEFILMQDYRVTNVTSFIGSSSPRFHTAYAPNMPSPNMGQILVNTISNEATKEIAHEYSDKYSDKFVNAHVRFKILAMQLSTAPIEVRISSNTLEDIKTTQNKVNAILNKTDGIGWVRTDWDQMQQSIKINLNKDKAGQLGYTKAYVATAIMAGLDGLPLTTIWEGENPVAVKLTQPSNNEGNIRQLEDQIITSPVSFTGHPLRSFATLEPEWNEGTIVRRNGVRTMTILVDNHYSATASNIFDEIKPQIDNLQLPEGTSISYGGDYEGQIEVFNPMAIALILSILLIFLILLLQFKKIKLSLLIMSTMLLSLPGAALGLVLMRYPFSITAFIGITSLIGMVVRNGIILLDYARDLKENHKMDVKQAALLAGKRRMRPIFLTAAAASMGVIPMILSRSPLWGPLGTVICFGLIISMVLTLFILPVLFALIYPNKTRKQGFRSVPIKSIIMVLAFLSPMIVTQSAAQNISLDSCRQMAVKNNRKIKAANYELQATAEQKKAAFTNYFPKVTANATVLRSNDYLLQGKTPEMNLPVYDGDPVSLETASQFAYIPSLSIGLVDYLNTVSVMAMQPVFAGHQISNGNKMAQMAVMLKQEQLSMTLTEVLLRTEELYWNTVALEEKLKTIISYQQMVDSLVSDVRVSYKAGLIQKSDLLKVQIKQTELKNKRMQLENGIRLSKVALGQQIGLDPTISKEIQLEPINPNENFPPFISGSENVKTRHEYQLLEKMVDISLLDKKLAIGANLPTLALGIAGYYLDVMDNSATNGLAFATLSIPITDWWGGSHKIKEKQIRVDIARNKMNETAELLTIQIQQTKQQCQEAYLSIDLARETQAQSAEHLNIITNNHTAGLSTVSDLLNAKAMYQQSLDQLTDAICQYKIAETRYKQAIGAYMP
ncbi:efflux RND transporter permease subunit [Geofilum sp. OHC36d9]|uniref:efflux RND transporter permease subunit n=1 Tax=Geofilum sp. OHC36d9 TaxID=3458413 RepID=UPI0040336C50